MNLSLNLIARSLTGRIGNISVFVLATFILLLSCVEPFEFTSENEFAAVVIEGHISDISADEYQELFGETRLFQVKLKYTGVVKNLYDEVIAGAEVELVSDQNEYWDYTESDHTPGVYNLHYEDFSAQDGVSYYLNVKLPNGEVYTSEPEQRPSQNNKGEITQTEISKQKLVYRREGQVIRSFAGLDVDINFPSAENQEPKYYRWDCLTIWKLKAELASIIEPGAECWISEIYYIDDFNIAIQTDLPVRQNLFFVQTSGNQKTKFGFSTRIRQMQMSEGYFQFWRDLQNQEEQAELFAPPPYNLFTNIEAVGHDKPAYGYFGVVNEENYTWFFDKGSLSYTPTYINECVIRPPREPAEWCYSCFGYGSSLVGTEITNVKPKWWTLD